MRKEHDFLGTMNVPDDVYYGVQTMRAVKNFHITGERLDPDFIKALATVKKAAALANMETGRLNAIVGKALTRAADEIIDGQWLDQFPVDPIQGGAGTSINMNMNEVLCNRALEILGKPKGRYDIISPNNHANMAQSTNDVFPTGIKVCLAAKGKALASTLRTLEFWLDEKADEFRNVLKMGRTHLQDAVPITLGQEMAAYASAVRRARRRIETSLDDVHVVNMGGTAVGTGLNAEPEYSKLAAAKLSDTRKGAAFLLEACRLLAAEMEGELEIILMGSDAAELSALSPVPVRALGYISGAAELAVAYSCADLFVIPSLEDNLPNTIMEAMACGTPCVGFRTGGIPEMIDHEVNGYVATSRDSADLARGIAWVLRHPEPGNLSAACREKVMRCYQESVVAKKYIALYQKLIQEKI